MKYREVDYNVEFREFNWIKFIVINLTGYFTFIFIMFLFNASNGGPGYSFIVATFSAIIGLIMFHLLLTRKFGVRVLSIVMGGFLLKMFIGVIHFLIFVQHEYFSGTTDYEFFRDYFWMHESIGYISDLRKAKGYFTPLPLWFILEDKGAFMFYYLSDLYYHGGKYVLNLCVSNTLFSQMTALIITYISGVYFKLQGRKLYFAAALAAFFPMSLIPSMTFRDITGQYFIAVGMTLLIKTVSDRRLIFLFPVICALFYMQRKNYVVLPLIAFLISILPIFGLRSQNRGLKKLANGAIIVILAIGLMFVISNLNTVMGALNWDVKDQLESDTYAQDFYKWQFYLFFPMYAFKGIMGPFPWVQFFKFTQETIFQPADYLMSVFFIVSFLIITKPIIFNFIKGRGFDIVTIMGMLFFMTGVASGVMHTGYLAIGFIFFIPYIAYYSNSATFKTYMIGTFIYFLLFNVIWISLGLYQSGLWHDVR